MSVLRFYLDRMPETDAEFSWALYGSAGQLERSGEGAPEEWPDAASVEAIIAASLVRLARVSLPRLSEDQLRSALPYAVEEKLAGEAEANHVAPGPRATDGSTPVAIVSKPWLHQALAALSERGVTVSRLLPENGLPTREADEWMWIDNPANGFVLTDEGASFAVDHTDAGLPPALGLALDARNLRGTGQAKVRCHTETQRWPAIAQALHAYGAEGSAAGAWDWRRAGSAAFASAIDMRFGEFALSERTGGASVWRLLRPAGWLAGAALLLHVVSTLGHWANVQWQLRGLDGELRALYARAFPEAPSGSALIADFMRQYSSSRHQRGEAAPDDVLPLLSRALPALRNAGVTDWRSATYADHVLTLEYPRIPAPKLRELEAALRDVEVSCLAADFEGGTRLRLGWML
jgi:general secretion pathway protein L